MYSGGPEQFENRTIEFMEGTTDHRQKRRDYARSESAPFIVAWFSQGNEDGRLSRERGSGLKVVDTSGWLEFFTDGPFADEYAARLAELSDVLTPTVVFCEVYKWTKRERREEEALVAISQLQKTRVIELTETIALTAAGLSLEHRLAMARLHRLRNSTPTPRNSLCQRSGLRLAARSALSRQAQMTNCFSHAI